jgi:hypothetical protein
MKRGGASTRVVFRSNTRFLGENGRFRSHSFPYSMRTQIILSTGELRLQIVQRQVPTKARNTTPLHRKAKPNGSSACPASPRAVVPRKRAVRCVSFRRELSARRHT